MAESSVMVNHVASAMSVCLDWNSSPDARQNALSYLESIKAGDVRVLGSTSFTLVKKGWPSNIRIQAFKMLQHLVRLRWDDLSATERRSFANVAVDLMSEIADPCEDWALKSQTAALVAEMIRREGASFWQELFPSLLSMSNQGPIQAEVVSMTLRWLPEDIMIHNEDLEGDRRRLLLCGLTESLSQILPLLYSLIERHFGAAITEASRQQLEVAKQHASTVTASLNAVNAYAEWSPLPDLAKYGIINASGFMLTSVDFRLHAVEFFKLVSQRRRPTDATFEYDSAMSQIFQILMNSAKDLFLKSSSGDAISESEFEFAECICESMVNLGSLNLKSVVDDATILSLYLQQMLGFFQHYKLVLHCLSMPFWLALMRDLLSRPKTVGSGEKSSDSITSCSGEADKEKKKILALINDSISSAILEMGFQRMLKKEKVHPQSTYSAGLLELWSDDFEDKGGFSHYRSRMLELIRFVASYKPLIAATKTSERIINIVKIVLLAAVPTQELPIMDSMQLPLENVVSTVFDDSNDLLWTTEDKLVLCRVFEGLLEQLLGLKWTEPALVQALGRYLDALGPFLKHYPDGVGRVIHKLFELLNSLPLTLKDPSTNTSRHARLQICTSFIRIAKTGGKSLLPHMKLIADTMTYLQKEGLLLRGEYNTLAEAFLIMASAAGAQQQQEVLEYFLEPLSKQWTMVDWQDVYLSEPAGFVRLCADTSFMWSLFHTLTFFEKALKRSGYAKGNTSSQSNSPKLPTNLHPMASHLSWMLPPLLKLLRCVHSLWAPPVAQALPAELKGAMIMSDVEKTSLMGEGSLRLPKSATTFSDGTQFDVQKEGNSEPVEKDLRNWLKGIRDSGYNVLGLSATIGDSLFKCMNSDSVAVALIENIQSMEFRHIRQLVHLVLIPLVKYCPPSMWDGWLQNILHPLLLHANDVVSCSWSCLLQEGRAKVPDLHGTEVGSDLKGEVMEEKLLRDLTREICSLLSIMASSSLNPGIPSLEPGHAGRHDLLNRGRLDSFASNSLIGFLVNQKNLAVPAFQISLEAFRWTDAEAVNKVCSFCGAIVHLAILTSDAELQEYVCRNLFTAIIQSLALESNAIVSTNLVALCCEIFVHLSQRNPAPREIMLSLPCVAPHDLLAFEEALSKISSSREQKQHMKTFLSMGTGNKLKAIAAQKNVNVITNVTAKPRNLGPAPELNSEEGDVVGLAAIM